jgi:hypothetical protein
MPPLARRTLLVTLALAEPATRKNAVLSDIVRSGSLSATRAGHQWWSAID